MLPRRLRLSRIEFSKATKGKSIFSEHLSLVFRPSPLGGCAVVVSKKVAKRSVDRHRIKRRLLALLRPYATPSRSLVVYAKKGADTVPFKELSKELTTLLTRTPSHS